MKHSCKKIFFTKFSGFNCNRFKTGGYLTICSADQSVVSTTRCICSCVESGVQWNTQHCYTQQVQIASTLSHKQARVRGHKRQGVNIYGCMNACLSMRAQLSRLLNLRQQDLQPDNTDNIQDNCALRTLFVYQCNPPQSRLPPLSLTSL